MEAIDYIEIYVSDLQKSIDFYKKTFHLFPVAYSEHEKHTSVLIQQGSIRLMLTAAKQESSQVTQFINTHGDGVKDIAFFTHEVEKYYQLALQKGHHSIAAPTSYQVGNDIILKATVSSFGNITHTFISRTCEYSSALPFFKPHLLEHARTNSLISIDHIAVCVNAGEISYYADNYIDTYDFIQSHEEDVVTEHSGMKSKAVQSVNGHIKIVFVEPIDGLKTSQVTEYLKHFGGPGVQHIAFSTEDIISVVKQLRESGLEMLSVPDGYYNQLLIKENDRHILREHSILFDRNQEGSLYQIFSKPIAARPTLFFEIIQRVGCTGFGSNNIKALFQAIEQEQFKHAVNLVR